jgi:uncharacterized protein (DUF1697 family)
VHVLFGLQPGPVTATELPDAAPFAPEELAVVGRDLHLLLPNGMGRAKLPVALGRVRSFRGTARSWRTVTTLLDMADALASE